MYLFVNISRVHFKSEPKKQSNDVSKFVVLIIKTEKFLSWQLFLKITIKIKEINLLQSHSEFNDRWIFGTSCCSTLSTFQSIHLIQSNL